LKFQAVAEKTAKDARGLLYFAHPVYQTTITAKNKKVTLHCTTSTFWRYVAE